MYISYDDGGWSQELNPNLPDMPIIDLIVEDNELVIGSHGRGFWILDNIAPLREASADMTTSGPKLFTPPTAVRSGPGVTLSWWLEEAAATATREVPDSLSDVLRTF